MTNSRRELIRTAAAVAVLVFAAAACRMLAHTPGLVLVGKLANFVRFLLYFGLFAAWGVSVRRRVLQLQVRRHLLSVSFLMLFWLTVRELRWHFVSDPAALRLLWYSYYIPILLILLLALFTSLSLGKPESYRLPRAAMLLYIPTFSLLLLVLTNDLHQLVFRFPLYAVQSELGYRYAPVFYCIVAWCVLCGLASFAVMLTRSRIPYSRRILWLPLLPFGFSLLYVVLYALRVPFVTDILGDLTVFECLSFTAFFECCIQAGLIRSNSRYSDLFRASVDSSMQITDASYRVRYAAASAEAVPPEDMKRAESGPVILPDGKRLYNMPVHGGHAIWTEDVSELLQVRETLEDRREELQERNALLQLEYEREKAHKTVEEQNRLYDLLQEKTQRQLDRIDRLVSEYRTASDPLLQRRILASIVVLGSFIKRRKDLVLSLDAAPSVPEERLASAFAESYRALSLLGIRGACLLETHRKNIPGEQAVKAYDFFEAVTELAMGDARFLSTRICPVEGELRVSILTDCSVSTEGLLSGFPQLRAAADEDGTSFVLPLEGGALA